MRIAKLIVLLLSAIAAGFLFGLLRPRRVTSRRDVVAAPTLASLGGDLDDRTK